MAVMKPVPATTALGSVMRSGRSPASCDAAVLAFVRPMRPPPGFSIKERIELDRWSQAAAEFGVSRVRLETPEVEDPPETRAFILVYMHAGEWARWGVALRDDALVELWSMTDGETLGCFASLATALTRLIPV